MGRGKETIRAVLSLLFLTAAAARGLDPKPPPKKPDPNTIIDKKKPGYSLPLDPREAADMDVLERAIEKTEKDQADLKAGAITQEAYDKALSETEKKVEEGAAKFPESAPVQTSAARAFIQAGDKDKAVAHASQAMALSPTDPFPVTTRSLAYFRAQDYPKAAQDAKRALELDPADPAARALYMLSKDRPAGGTLLQGAAPRVRHALDCVSLPESPFFAPPERVKDDDPELSRYKTAAGRAYVRQIRAAERALIRRDYLTAYGTANAALTVYADNPRLFAARAVAAFSLQDYKTAASDAALVLKSHPNMATMLTVRAAAFNEMSRHAEALADAEKAVALSATQARSFLERAIAHENLNDASERALDDYKHAAELDPSFTADYMSALARLSPATRSQSAAALAADSAAAPQAGSAGAAAALFSRARGLEPTSAGIGALALLALVAGGLVLIRRAMG